MNAYYFYTSGNSASEHDRARKRRILRLSPRIFEDNKTIRFDRMNNETVEGKSIATLRDHGKRLKLNSSETDGMRNPSMCGGRWCVKYFLV